MKKIRLPSITVPTLKTVREQVFTVGGLGLLTLAALDYSRIAGLAAGGVSLLLLEWLTRPSPTPGGRQ